jgi:hypothetical protein
MAVLPIMRAHKTYRCKHLTAGAIAQANVMFGRPAQKRNLIRSSVQRHQASTITAIEHPKAHHVMVSYI